MPKVTRTAWCVVAMLSVCAHAQPPSANTGRIEGRILSTTGEPVRKATVRVQIMSGPPSGYVEMSAADGSFVIAAAAPGHYFVTAEKSGFAPLRAVIPVNVTAGQTERVEVKIPELGVIAGRVVDEDGDPAPGVSVSVMRYRWQGANRVPQRGSGAVADDRGEFRLTNIEPDRYYIIAEDKRTIAGALLQGNFVGAAARLAALPTYYPSEDSIARARAVQVQGGGETGGIVIRQRRGQTFSVRGRSVNGLTGETVNGAVQAILKDNANQLRTSSATRQADGSFEVRGLQPGEYVFQLATTDPADRQRQITGLTEVTVNGDIDGVTLRVFPNFALSGRVTVEDGELAELLRAPQPNPSTGALDGPPMPRFSISMLRSGPVGAGGGVTSQVAPDGAFRYPSVAPGLYTISMPQLAPGVYVKSVRAGGAELTNAPLDLMQRVPGPIEIVLASDGAKLAFAMPPEDGVRRMAVVWPKTPRGLLANAGVATNAALWTFPPGDYYFAVFVDTDAQLTQSYGFLTLFNGLATEITLKAGETTTAEPAVIPHAKVEEVLGGLP